MATARIFTEKQCGRVLTNLYSPELADFAGHQIQLTMIYTDGKDANWSHFSSTPETKGVMTGAFLIPKSRIAAGGALVDLKACAAGVSMGKLGLRVGIGGSPTTVHNRSANLAELRYAVIRTLAHEVFHMIQAWRAGNTYDGNEVITPSSLRYTETFKRLMDQIARNHPNQSSAFVGAAAHARHPSEQEAEQFAGGRLARYRTSVERGDWDVCLPIDILKTYIN